MNHYERLGISRNATDDEIRKAYRKAALRTHPDKKPTNKLVAEEEFKKIGTAYTVLSNTVTRRKYDQHLDGIESQTRPSTGASRRRHAPAAGSNTHGHEWHDPDVDMQQAEELLRVVNQLLEAYLKEQARRRDLGVDLANAASGERWDDVTNLIDQGAFLDELSSEGKAAIHYAVCNNDYRHTDALFLMGADINKQTNNGKTALHLAVEMNNYEICQLLVLKKAKLHYQDYSNKDTPLHFAVEHRGDQRIQWLLIQYATEYGLIWTDKSYNCQDLLGDTPLHLAVKTEQYDSAEMLISFRAKTSLRNREGKTPVDIARVMQTPPELTQKLECLSQEEEKNKSVCLIM